MYSDDTLAASADWIKWRTYDDAAMNLPSISGDRDSRFFFAPMSRPVTARHFRVRKITTNTGNVGMSEWHFRCDNSYSYVGPSAQLSCSDPWCTVDLAMRGSRSALVLEGTVQVR